MSLPPSAPADEASPKDPTPSSPPPPASALAARTRLSSLFLPPKPQLPPSSSTSPSDLPNPSRLLDAGTEEPSWSSDAASAPSDAPTGSSGTPSIGKGGRVSKAGLRTTIGGAVRKVCKLVAAMAADEEERAAGLWRPDDDDVEDIADPATSLVWRRLPDEAKGSDAMDLLSLGLALVGYVGKNLKRRQDIRGRRLRGGAVIVQEPDAGAAP